MSKNIYTSGDYIEKHPTWHVEDSLWKAKQIIKILKANSLRPNSICEVGCGAGEILNQLYLQMPNTVSFAGYEISPYAYELCQRRKKDRLKFYLDDFVQDNHAFFDILLIIDVIEHVEDYYGFLRKLHDKGDYKIFHIPLEINVLTTLRTSAIVKGRQSMGHIHYFSKETAFAALVDTGYKVIDYFYTARSLEVHANSIRSLFAKMSRKISYKINNTLAVRVLGGYSIMILTK